MTNEQLQECVAAEIAGKQVQQMTKARPVEWKDCQPGHTWSTDMYDYRVKPVLAEMWVNFYPYNWSCWETEQKARGGACPDAVRVAVHMKEVQD